METIYTTYLGGLRTQATHVQSNYQLITDVPKEHGGQGASYSPTDLFCAAIISSMLSNMAGIEKNADLDRTLQDVKIRSTKVLQQNPTMVKELIIDFDLPGTKLLDEQKTKLEAAAHNSQVGRSLSPELELTVTFNY